MEPVGKSLTQIFREERGRVLALLVRLLDDLDRAEDVLQEAFARAHEHWPREGIPARPGAWITTVARRLAMDTLRRSRTRQEVHGEHDAIQPEPDDDEAEHPFPDERLRLVFTCCHPSLQELSRVALTLRMLGGLSTPEIARALLTPETALAQRIVRAKQRIREARIPYAIPKMEELPERLQGVLTVVYLIFNEGYAATAGDDVLRLELSDEAIRLGRILLTLLPDEPEAMGLVALMLLHDARRGARVGAAGEFVPLEEQDRSLWDQTRIEEGSLLLDRAIAFRRRGPFQIQAAIAALHASARSAEETDWLQIEALYGALLHLAPSPIVELNRAIAAAMARGPDVGLQLVDKLERDGTLVGYALLPAVRADLLRRAGYDRNAENAYREAIAVARNVRDRAYLEKRLAGIISGQRQGSDSDR